MLFLVYALLAVLGLVLYFHIGRFIGAISWKIWHGYPVNRFPLPPYGIQGFLLWPFSWLRVKRGEKAFCYISDLSVDVQGTIEREYLIKHSFLWPLRLALNMLGWFICIGCIIVTALYEDLLVPIGKLAQQAYLFTVFGRQEKEEEAEVAPETVVAEPEKLQEEPSVAAEAPEEEFKPLPKAPPEADQMTELQQLEIRAGELESSIVCNQEELDRVRRKITQLKTDPNVAKVIELRQARPQA